MFIGSNNSMYNIFTNSGNWAEIYIALGNIGFSSKQKKQLKSDIKNAESILLKNEDRGYKILLEILNEQLNDDFYWEAVPHWSKGSSWLEKP